MVLTNRLGVVGMYLNATLLKNHNSTIPIIINAMLFSITIFHIPDSFPQSNFNVMTIDRIEHNNNRMINKEVALTNLFFSAEYERGDEYIFCHRTRFGLNLSIVGRTYSRFLFKI
jgi:hypothetical protein